MVVWGL